MNPDNGENAVPQNSEPSAPSAYFDIDQAEASKYLDYLAKYPRSKQICICGHTVTSHRFSTSIGYTCKPNNHYCPCQRIHPVYFAGNARHFKRSTHGPGMKHALSLGIVAMRKSGAVGQWLVELKCSFPGCKNPEIVPSPMTKENRVPESPTPLNLLLCRSHVVEFGGDLIW
jgi:hypothetical protein